MLKHYFHPASRAATTDWMLRELDVPHERIVVDFLAGETQSPTYRAINPMGKVPALVDGDVVVTETAAICAYLADRFVERGLAPPPGAPERGLYYRCLFFTGTTLEPLLTVTKHGLTDVAPQSVGWGDMERCMAAVESMTPDAFWVLGERFSAADVVFGGMLDSCIELGLLEQPSPRVRAYVKRLKSRSAYRQTHPEAWHGD